MPIGSALKKAGVGCILLLLAACGGSSAPTVDVVVVGSAEAPFESGVRLSPAGQLVRGATAEGLVALDEQGSVVPALADRWIVTDDGLSYIFRLRDGAWPDGSEISGESARQALRQALSALKGTGLALDLSGIDEIRTMAGRVIEIRLSRPLPDLLQVLAQPELALLHNGKGGGPMTLTREGALALLTPIPPERLGLPQAPDWKEQVRSLRVQAQPADVAARRFAAGDVDIVLGGRFETVPAALGVAGLSQRVMRIDPAPGLFGLAAVSRDGFLAAPEQREAVAMAVDRDALASAFALRAWTPMNRILPGSGERWADLSMDQRRSAAAARVARWKGLNGTAPSLRVALPAGPGADILFGRLSADLSAIGIGLQRVGEGEGADLRLVDVVARYARPEWYLTQLSCAAARGLCSDAADGRLEQARAAPDDASRAALLAQADAALTASNVFIPLGNPIRWSLVRDGVTGFAENPLALHSLLPLARRKS